MWLNQEQYEQVLSQLYQFREDELLYKRRFLALQNTDLAKYTAYKTDTTDNELYASLPADQTVVGEPVLTKHGANLHPKSKALLQISSIAESQLVTTVDSQLTMQSTSAPTELSIQQTNAESKNNDTVPAQSITWPTSYATDHRLSALIHAFTRSLSQADLELIQREKMIIPELSCKKPDLITEEFYFNSHEASSITVLKHNRYTPVFEHRHVFFEMVYVLSGRCKQIIMDQKIDCQAGDFYLIGPDTKHSLDVHRDDTIVLNILIRRSAIEFALPDILCGNNVLSQFFNQNLFSRSVNPYLLIATSRNLNAAQTEQISSALTESSGVNATNGLADGLAEYLVANSSNRSTAKTINPAVSNETLLNSKHYMSNAPQRRMHKEQYNLNDEQSKQHDAQKLEEDELSRQSVEQSIVDNGQSQHTDETKFSQSFYINTANNAASKTSQSMIAQLVVAMYWESLHPRAYSDKKLNGGLMLLFGILLQDYASQMILPHCKRNTDKFMAAVYDYLEENFKDASLHDLSKRLNLCEAHVSRKIRKACSQSFSSLRQDLIFSKVCVLLEHSNLSATAISEMMGFNTVEHFYRQFKKRYGITCNEYRQRYAPQQLKVSVVLP